MAKYAKASSVCSSGEHWDFGAVPLQEHQEFIKAFLNKIVKYLLVAGLSNVRMYCFFSILCDF